MKAHDVDVIVADEHMPSMSGSDLIAWVATHCPETMRIMLTGRASLQTAIRAINEGAVYHFFVKPCDDVQLALAIRKAIEHRALLREYRHMLECAQNGRLANDLARLAAAVEQDLKAPLEQTARSLKKLTARHPELFDPTTEAQMDRTLESVKHIQKLAAQLHGNC
jgi:DNA-binding NtrC family response regulator